MKQCPVCKEHFADEQNFCDTDGTPLIEKVRKGPGLNAEALPPVESSRGSQVWPIVTIGILIGVIICLTAYAVMMTPPAEKDGRNNRGESAKVNPSERLLPATATRTEPLPAATIPEASPEASATETASPSPAAAAQAPQAPASALNTGPISTDRENGEKRGRMLIKLKNGVMVEADAAWADQLGIWYRQGGLVSYVERDRIESIAEPSQPKSSPAETNKP
jgi:hypothetical protein